MNISSLEGLATRLLAEVVSDDLPGNSIGPSVAARYGLVGPLPHRYRGDGALPTEGARPQRGGGGKRFEDAQG